MASRDLLIPFGWRSPTFTNNLITSRVVAFKKCCALTHPHPHPDLFLPTEFSKRTLHKGSGDTQKGAAHGEPHPGKTAEKQLRSLFSNLGCVK